jgi:hypothetical protein
VEIGMGFGAKAFQIKGTTLIGRDNFNKSCPHCRNASEGEDHEAHAAASQWTGEPEALVLTLTATTIVVYNFDVCMSVVLGL